MLIRDTNIKIDRDRCTACGICIDRCILDNLRLSVAPCRQSCPLHINCQGFIRLLAREKEQQALEMLREYLPFLGLLGRLCHAPCEKACARKKVDEPVNIRSLYKYLAENKSEYIDDICQQERKSPTGKKVVIWGSGPAAMMAAWRLSRSGHEILMMEPGTNPGRALRDSDFASQVDNETINALVDAITAAGTDLETRAETVGLDDLVASYDAVIITCKDDDTLSGITDANNAEMPLKADPRTLQAVEQKKLFICRELSPKSRLVDALAMGKAASESVDRFLSGVPLMWERGFWHAKGNVKDYTAPYERARHVQPDGGISIHLRKEHENDGILKPFSKDDAVFEAQRCLGCGRPFDSNRTCWYCLPCEIECPHNAIEVRIPYLLR